MHGGHVTPAHVTSSHSCPRRHPSAPLRGATGQAGTDVRYRGVQARPRTVRRAGIRLALLRLAPFGLMLLIQLTWFRSITASPDPMAAVRRDWTAFYETGRRVVAG